MRMPRSRTERIPSSLVVQEVVFRVLGPGIGEIEYGERAAAICLSEYASVIERTVAKVPPDGLELRIREHRQVYHQ